MTSSSHQRELLLRYLLNEMTSFEREEVDTALIADPEFADSLEDARHDLLDDYAAGRLPSSDAARVQQTIAANKSFAQAARSAGALRLARLQPQRGTPARFRFHFPASSRFHFPVRIRFYFPALTIAASLLIAMGSLIAIGIWRYNSSMPAPQVAVQSGAPPPASASTTPTTAAPSALPTVSTPAKPTHRTPAAFVATLLMPETSRSGEATPLLLPANIRTIRVEWPVSADIDSNQPLTLTVLQDADRIEQMPEQLPRQTIGDTPLAHFALPTGRLQPGTYIFRITAPEPSEPPLVELAVQVKRG